MTAQELTQAIKNIGFEAKEVAEDIVEVSLKNRRVGVMEVETAIYEEIGAEIALVTPAWSGVWVYIK